MPEPGPAPLVVIAAPNGARLNKRGHPAVLVTTAEIAAAAAELAELGFSNVLELDGGMRAWERSGRDLAWK